MNLHDCVQCYASVRIKESGREFPGLKVKTKKVKLQWYKDREGHACACVYCMVGNFAREFTLCFSRVKSHLRKIWSVIWCLKSAI